jgi:GNAT superfamily N-acetyltransferase
VSARLTKASLWNVTRAASEPAEIWDAITETQLEHWELQWKPELFASLARLKDAGVPRQLWPQSRHWNWRAKTEAFEGLLAHPGFSVMCAGITQGLMILDVASQRCRIDSQRGKDVVYVKFLENAPWNRAELLYDPPRYRGVGSILMRTAIERSRHEGFKGRVGLHALPQADDFYRITCGMTDLGADPDPDYQRMRYFEMTSEQAEVFIAKGNRP